MANVSNILQFPKAKYMFKLFKRLVLYFVVFVYTYCIAALVFYVYMDIGKHSFMLNNYIRSINTPNHTNELTIQYLNDINKITGTNIIKFTGDSRPIDIIEASDFDDTTIGFASPLPNSCLIEIDENLLRWDYKETLYHELMHCYGYVHTGTKEDLMYPYISLYIDLDSNLVKYVNDITSSFLYNK